ncbi:MAG: TrgA family protein [Pseudomonadota bacterium]
MPTPAKLVAAILFAAVAWWVGETIVRYGLPEGVRVGWFREILAAGGLVIGWKTIGKACTGPMNRGTSISIALTSGLGAALILLLLGLILHSFYDMITESLGSKYTEVGAAASAWMEFMWRDTILVADPIILGTLFGGGAVVGLFAGAVGRLTR